MKLTSLDLEMNQPSGRIIQIGACVGDTNTGEILETLSVLVHPGIGDPITEFITGLTGITQQQVDTDGTSLLEAYDILKDLHTRHQCFMNPLTWGGGDSYELKKQLERDFGWVNNWCFGRRWIDVKTLYHTRQLARDGKVQAGLARALTKLGLQFKGRKHNAKDDAVNTFYAYLELSKVFKNDNR